MVGIALLTLVPGQLGGSETYVRELLRTLARGGELDYRVLLPPVAPLSSGRVVKSLLDSIDPRLACAGGGLFLGHELASGKLRRALQGDILVRVPDAFEIRDAG